MGNTLHGYSLITPFTSENSGTARWCFAKRDGREYFIKEFISPTFPEGVSLPQEIIQTREAICRMFEQEKQKLYGELQAADNGNIVPVVHFFRDGCKYYAVAHRVRALDTPIENAYDVLGDSARLTLVKTIAYNLMRVHKAGIVYADLRPANLMLKSTCNGSITVKIIDFDNSFFESCPPEDPDDIHGDPVFFAPETYLALCEEEVTLTRKLDVFALGILFHLIMTGELPVIDEKYHYIYECVMDGETPELSDSLTPKHRELIYSMLKANPDARPSCVEVFASLQGDESAIIKNEDDDYDGSDTVTPPPEPKPINHASSGKNGYFKPAGDL